MGDDKEYTDDLGDTVEETLELIFIRSVEIFGFTSWVLGLELDSGSHNSLILPIPQDVVILETSLQPIFPGSSPADIAFILSSSSSYLIDYNIKSGYSYLCCFSMTILTTFSYSYSMSSFLQFSCSYS